MPGIAWALDRALRARDAPQIDRLIEGFHRPHRELRNQVPGYGVSLIKGGLALRGRPTGGVRPPLVAPSAQHLEELAALIARGLALVRRD